MNGSFGTSFLSLDPEAVRLEGTDRAMPAKRAPTSIDRSIGKRIRERRRELGINQRNLADAVGVTFQQVQKYEEASNRIAAGRLYEFAVVLGVEIGYFFEKVAAARKAKVAGKRPKPLKRKS